MKKNERVWTALFLAPACIIFILIFALPLFMVFQQSLFDYRLMPNTYDFIGFKNYIQLFTADPKFWNVLKNTVLWILIHCILHVGLGSGLAFVLYKKPRGWKFVRVVYMIPNIISQAAIAMIFLNVFNAQYGALNSIFKSLGLEKLMHNWLFEQSTAFPAVTMTWFLFAGYTTTLVLAQLLGTDESYVEAARVDGANNFQIDRMIMFPIVKQMIGTTVIMAATYMLQLFSMLLITTGGGPGDKTTNLPLYLYLTMKSNNYGYSSTIGVIIIILGFVTMKIINKVFGMNKED